MWELIISQHIQEGYQQDDLKQQDLCIMEHGWLQMFELILTQIFWQLLHEMVTSEPYGTPLASHNSEMYLLSHFSRNNWADTNYENQDSARNSKFPLKTSKLTLRYGVHLGGEHLGVSALAGSKDYEDGLANKYKDHKRFPKIFGKSHHGEKKKIGCLLVEGLRASKMEALV